MKKKKIVLIIYIFLIFMSFFIRFYHLGSPLLHHDEGVNGYFSLNILNRQGFQYDPTNYHGPTLYYLTFIPFTLFEPSNFTLRLIPALFGASLLFLFYPLRKYFGNTFLLTASFLTTFSPTLVYYSRYAIHETLLIFFTVSLLLFIYLYIKEKKIIYAYLLAINTALLLATKETAYIFLFILLAFLIFLFLKNKGTVKINNIIYPSFAFILVYVALFSSFFTDLEGILRSFYSIESYFHLGTLSGAHAKPFYYYFTLIFKYEPLVLIFTVASILFFFINKKVRRNQIFLFMIYWCISIFLIYSLISYKTPWLVINLTLPMIILSSYTTQVIQSTYKNKFLLLAILFLILSSSISVYYIIKTNFIYFSEDDYNNLAYAHTHKDINFLLSLLKEKSKEYPLTIQVNLYNQWPLPWYFYLEKYTLAKNHSLWEKIFLLNQLNLDATKKEKIESDIQEQLDSLDYPIILGYSIELENLSIPCYEKRQYQLRKNVWLAIFYPSCKELNTSKIYL